MAPTTAVRQLLIKVPQLLQGASDERIGKVLFAIAWHLPESTAQGLMEIHSTAPNVLRAALLQLAGGSATVTRLVVPLPVLCVDARSRVYTRYLYR